VQPSRADDGARGVIGASPSAGPVDASAGRKVMVVRRIRAGLLVAALGAVALLGIGGVAEARSYDGLCESGEVCLYWGGNYTGGVADFENTIYNYKSFYFKGHGSGAGSPLNDNSQSVRSRARGLDAVLCVDSYFRGKCFELKPGDAYLDLGPDFNNKLSSHFWHG
jgi:Peptidase inhibitor family I36